MPENDDKASFMASARRWLRKLVAGAPAVKAHGEGAFNPGRGHPLRSAGGCRWNDPSLLVAKETALLAGERTGVPTFAARVFERWGGTLPKSGVRVVIVGGGDDDHAVAWARDVPGVEMVARVRDAGDREFKRDVVSLVHADCLWEEAEEFAPFHLAVGENALCRLPNLEERLARLGSLLVPGGIVAVREYVGPNRYQFTPGQLDLANALLRLLPGPLRRYIAGIAKESQELPELGWLMVNDPRAALRSESVRGEIAAAFEVVEEIELGGAVLMPLLAGIAHNFLEDSRECRKLLEVLWRNERSLMLAGLLPSDHWAVAAINTRRPAAAANEGVFIERNPAF